MHRFPMLIPLAVGVITFVCTIFVHALPLSATITIARRERRLGKEGVSFWGDFAIVALINLFSLVAHLIEIALWAAVFVICGEFQEFGTAYYHSAVNYTTLGYGDLLMSPKWRLLGPLEAANGDSDVRDFDRGDFYPHSTVDSGEVCGSQGLRACIQSFG